MTTQEATVGKKQVPIIPWLVLPTKEGEAPYLSGVKCKSCGQVYTGQRMACSKCFAAGQFEEIKLSNRGEVHVFSVVHQSAPGIDVPYVSAIVDLPEGVSVRCNLSDVDPMKPETKWFGMPVEMYTEKVRTDSEGNEIIAFKFRPAKN